MGSIAVEPQHSSQMSKIKVEFEVNGKWSRWVPPKMKGYKMACCDCGLVHDMQFKVVEVTKTMKDGSWLFVPVKAGKYRVMFRASRNKRSTGQVRRHKGRRSSTRQSPSA